MPPRGGMPKWLIILLVVLVVVILGCCGGVTTCFFLARKAVKAAPGFMQEQMKKQGVELNMPDASGTTAMPSNFPTDIPVYSGLKVTYSAAEIPKEAGQATFTSSGSAADIKTFYDKQMIDNGWTQDSTNTNAEGSSSTYSKDTRTASISINSSGSTSNVVVIYGKK
jgi:hypothetical protein